MRMSLTSSGCTAGTHTSLLEISLWACCYINMSSAGSENTNSAVHGQSAAMSFNGSVISPSHPHAQPSQPKDNFAWVESQQSMDNPKNKPRKASFVEKPIRQSKKQRTDIKANASGMPARHVTRAMAKADGTKTKFQMMN
jgi:hypothetical protein